MSDDSSGTGTLRPDSEIVGNDDEINREPGKHQDSVDRRATSEGGGSNSMTAPAEAGE